ncbi:MAG TPA: DUF2142 domain-containing protein [Thermoanaerobaculia bacterium]|nr:DUF2142 domain-containing protein [Thermoanaerobaculia bacterium]
MKADIDRLYLVAGLAAALLFAFITPPFQVPDEVGHFWRAASIADGHLLPETNESGSFATVADGIKGIVFVLWRDIGGKLDARITWVQFRTAWDVSLRPDEPRVVRIPAGYTPVPYAPQIAGALAGKIAGFRPVITFYLGRLCNAVAFVLIVTAAIRVTPVLKAGLAVAGLLPMTSFLAGSWSPDAMTIAVCFLLAALLLRAITARGTITPRETATLIVVSVLLGLCKPAYFLLTLLALAIPAARFRSAGHRVLIMAVLFLLTAGGVALSMLNAQRAFIASADQQVDPAAQIRCVVDDPLRFVALAAREVAGDLEYVEQGIGRLGMLDVRLPRAMFWIELIVLVVAAFSAGTPPGAVARVLAGLAASGSASGIALSTYLGWNQPCAAVIEGLQGRYFIPILPLLMMVVAMPLLRRPVVEWGLIAASVAANVAGLAAVFQRYY